MAVIFKANRRILDYYQWFLVILVCCITVVLAIPAPGILTDDQATNTTLETSVTTSTEKDVPEKEGMFNLLAFILYLFQYFTSDLINTYIYS